MAGAHKLAFIAAARQTLCAGLLWACLSQGVESAEARIAVAANFRNTALVIAEALQRTVSYEIIAGSTGKLASQILNGAPYDIFMAADVTGRSSWLIAA